MTVTKGLGFRASLIILFESVNVARRLPSQSELGCILAHVNQCCLKFCALSKVPIKQQTLSEAPQTLGLGKLPRRNPKPWILPPLSNSWIISIIWLYIALDITPSIDCYWVGAVPYLTLGQKQKGHAESKRALKVVRVRVCALCSGSLRSFHLTLTIATET